MSDIHINPNIKPTRIGVLAMVLRCQDTLSGFETSTFTDFVLLISLTTLSEPARDYNFVAVLLFTGRICYKNLAYSATMAITIDGLTFIRQLLIEPTDDPDLIRRTYIINGNIELDGNVYEIVRAEIPMDEDHDSASSNSASAPASFVRSVHNSREIMEYFCSNQSKPTVPQAKLIVKETERNRSIMTYLQAYHLVSSPSCGVRIGIQKTEKLLVEASRTTLCRHHHEFQTFVDLPECSLIVDHENKLISTRLQTFLLASSASIFTRYLPDNVLARCIAIQHNNVHIVIEDTDSESGDESKHASQISPKGCSINLGYHIRYII